MSEAEPVATYFEGEPAALMAWLAGLGWSVEHGPDSGPTDPAIVAFGPVVERQIMGQQVAFALLMLRDTLVPPEGVIESDVRSIATGVFMAGPSFPTPREWMDRLPMSRQLEIYTAAQGIPALGFALYRLAASQGVDVTLAETTEFVGQVQAAGLITADEAAALLQP